VATNVAVVNQEKFTCDIDIPFEADFGKYDVEVTNPDDKTGKGVQLFDVTSPTPTVTAIDPNEAETGSDLTDVTITGTKFVAPAEVKLAKAGSPDIVATNVAVVNQEKFTCDINIPFDADDGLYDVVVTNSGGKIGTGEQIFAVIGTDPIITGIDPEDAEVDQQIDGATITGANFLAPAEIKLTKDGATDIVATNVIVINPETITCDIDIPFETNIGLYDVELTNGDAKIATGVEMFEVTGPTPSVAGIDPKKSEAGEKIDVVTIIGQKFLGPAEVKLTKSGAPDIVCTNVDVLDSQIINCEIDIPLASPTGLYDVVVTNHGGKSGTGVELFEVTAPTPTVTGIAPDEAEAGENLSDVTITGTKFLGPADVKLTKPSAPDITATNVVVVDSQIITCDINIPFEADLGLYDVVVTISGGKIATGYDMFEVHCPTPHVTGIDPDSGETGENLTDVEVTGSKFWGPGAQVKLEMSGEPDIDATNVVVNTPSLITCDLSIPHGTQTGLYDVSVTNACGSQSTGGANLFEITESPLQGWAQTWGGGDTDDEWEDDGGEDVAVDDSGNIYVAGYFRETVDFDPGPGTEEHTSNGDDDAFLTKFDSNGNFLWACTWGGENPDSPNKVAIDDIGNVYVIGCFYSTVDFDPSQGTDIHISNGERDIFLSKFNSNGDFQWAQTWGGTGNDRGFGVAADNLGNVYATGDFHGTVDLNPGPGVDEHTSNGYWSAFLSKFNSNGDFQWVQTWDDRGFGIAVDNSGNSYITGYFDGTEDFDPGPGVDEHTSNGDEDIFLSKFNSNGDFQWALTWGGTGQDWGHGVDVSNPGNIYVTGDFQLKVDFDPGPGTDEQGAGLWFNVFLSKFNSNGDYQWARTWGGDDWDSGQAVAVDDFDNAYVAGYFYEDIDFDPGPGTDEHQATFAYDAFLSKFNSNGDYQWARPYGAWSVTKGPDCGEGVAVDDSGNIYFTGYFFGTIDFDPGPGVDNHTSVPWGTDVFLVKFLPDGYW
jgi:hypothetical protein